MSVEKARAHALISWISVAVLVSLCATLGMLQYRWIGEVSRAEHDRLRAGLQERLRRLAQDFNTEITAACSALIPSGPLADEKEAQEAYAVRYLQWRNASRHARLFRRIMVAVPQNETLELHSLDLDRASFASAQWPAEWTALKERLTARMVRQPPGGPPGAPPAGPPFNTMGAVLPAVIDLPRFGRPPGGGPGGGPPPFDRPPRFAPGGGNPPPPFDRRGDWLLVELDLDYVRSDLLPELLQRHLGDGEKPEYLVEIVTRENPATVIYQSDADGAARIGTHADASIGLLAVRYDQIFRRDGRGRGMPPPGPEAGRWMLSVRHRAGSLEAVVAKARYKNLAVTSAVLLLMLATIAAMVRFTRRAQRLAELQMEFVAGVSHELRTPLSVIRTAAHNLGGGLISSGKQVQRYGALIADEAEKLAGIVEQVLLFSSAKAGRVLRTREVVAVDSLIESALDGCSKIVQDSRCTVEKQVAADLAPLWGDPTALKHALQNLVSNAAKYAPEGGWIRISAAAVDDAKQPTIEIRVADRGSGIPADELGHIFDSFYRGRRAVEDQIHGTGLGLSLVKRIVEAHGGTVSVQSEPGKGTEFVLRMPAAPADQVDEFADSASRR